MFKPVYNALGKLTADISNVANVLLVTHALYSALEAVLGIGGSDHTYLLITDGINTEVVKVTSLTVTTVVVSRAQDGTTALAFSTNADVYFAMTAIAVTDIVDAAITAASLPASLTFEINAPNTVEQVGDIVTLNIPKLPITSPDATIDITTVGDGYGIDVERGAFGCCDD